MKRLLLLVALLVLVTPRVMAFSYSSSDAGVRGVKPTATFVLADGTDLSRVPNGGSLIYTGVPFCSQVMRCGSGADSTQGVVLAVDRSVQSGVVSMRTARMAEVAMTNSAVVQVTVFLKAGAGIVSSYINMDVVGPKPLLRFRGDIVAVKVWCPTVSFPVIVNFY